MPFGNMWILITGWMKESSRWRAGPTRIFAPVSIDRDTRPNLAGIRTPVCVIFWLIAKAGMSTGEPVAHPQNYAYRETPPSRNREDLTLAYGHMLDE